MLVKQIANLLDLLEFFSERKEPATLAEIAQSLAWPKSSTFNILSTLSQRGYLYEPRGRGGYYPTTRWDEVLRKIHEMDQLTPDLLQTVDTLSKVTGETCVIVAISGTNAVCLYVAESSAPIRFSASPGFQLPLHASAAGRALLVQLDESDRAALLKRITYKKYLVSVRTPQNATETMRRIRDEKEQGWHQTEGEGNDLVGIGLPYSISGRPLAIVVGGPATRIQDNAKKILTAMQREFAGLRNLH